MLPSMNKQSFSYWIVLLSFAFLVLIAGHLTILKAGDTDQAMNNGDLANRSLSEIIRERSATKDPERAKQLAAFLREKAAPQTKSDLEYVEKELAQPSDGQKAQALTWLSNITDIKLKPELLRFFDERRALLSPERIDDLSKHPEQQAKEIGNQEILGNLMLKLADLNAREIIPVLRAYATAKGADSSHMTVYAYQALARIKDEDFFGKNRRERLRRGYVDVNDAKTKPWLEETALNDPDHTTRYIAADTWSQQVANPKDPDDMAFAWKLINNPGADLRVDEKAGIRAHGFNVLKRAVAKGNLDRKIFAAAVEEAQRKDARFTNKIDATHLLIAFGKHAEFRNEALNALNQILNGPDGEAHGAASRAIGKLTGTAPHYEGEPVFPANPEIHKSLVKP